MANVANVANLFESQGASTPFFNRIHPAVSLE